MSAPKPASMNEKVYSDDLMGQAEQTFDILLFLENFYA